MRQLGALSLIVCIAAATGCNVCCWGKRAEELGSPTDIRKAHFWCLGEDAVFHQPCGPSKEDYGLKATCWREWPADGGRCKPGACPPNVNCGLNGNCAPLELPMTAPQPAAPPSWELPTPAEEIPSANPFRDDAPKLPAPSSSRPTLRKNQAAIDSSKPKAQATEPRLPALSLVEAPPMQRLPQRQRFTETAASAKSISVTPLTVTPPALLGTVTAGPKLSKQVVPLKITVSPQIDDPARPMPQIVAPKNAALPKISPSDVPRLEAETLAGFERMFETAASPAARDAGPLVMRNEYALESKPFRLSTRASQETTATDPQLKKETLSALGLMISDASEPHASK